MATEENKKTVIQDRIYIGNVDYKASEDELKELFEGYKVTEVDIPFKEITRGANKPSYKKHLGFAFVQFDSADEADRAITEYNGKQFKERVIYVKKAVPPPTHEEKQKKIEAYKAKLAKKKEVAKAAKEATSTAKELKPEEESKSTAKKTPAPKKKAEKPAKANGTNPEASAAEDKAKNSPPEGIPSKDTVFITNLSYRVSIKDLNQLFKELNPVWIHIPKQRVPYSFVNKSKKPFRVAWNKGIAFVKLADEETQKRAIAEFNGKDLNGRPIIVDVAIDSRDHEPSPSSAPETTESPTEASA